MKVVALVSGGKDSCYAMMKCIQYGHEIVALANLMPADDAVDELDSYMYQTVGHQIINNYAECMGVPLFRRRIRGTTRHQSLSYRMTPGDEVEDMFVLLNEIKRQIPSIAAVSSGAIASDYQRLRVESVCSRLGLVSLAYLWKQDQSMLLHEMITSEIVAITVKVEGAARARCRSKTVWRETIRKYFAASNLPKEIALMRAEQPRTIHVAALGLDPAKHLGKEMAYLEPYLHKLKNLYGINVCGEGGEYETLTLDCPLFINARIVLDDFQVVLHSQDSIAPVGVLHPVAFHLEHKTDSIHLSGCSRINDACEDKILICEVQDDCILDCEATSHSVNVVSDLVTVTKHKIKISKTKKDDKFSICCWLPDSCNTSTGLQEDLNVLLNNIELQLLEYGFGWENVLYIHLYIDDMDQFSTANETYVKYITQNKCRFGVPSRSTIELPLLQVGLGRAYLEVLVASDQSKRVLHVQSISCWAPSCIGPYSQATLHKEILFMAGQLGLDPPTMNLCTGGPTAELEQALQNCEAVAKSFRCSIATSAILFVIYCSKDIPSSERNKIQEQKDKLLKQMKLLHLDNGNMVEVLDPIFLFVLVPDLPKRALVEVKPILYVPDDVETTAETAQLPCIQPPNSWGFQHELWHASCIKQCGILGQVCAAVLSITKKLVPKICSEYLGPEQNDEDFHHFLKDGPMQRIARLCIYLLDKVLLENGFSWEDATSVRIYFPTTLCTSFETLSLMFSNAFQELAETSQRISIGKDPIFNLVPALGAGMSAVFMDDIITCELFAQKS